MPFESLPFHRHAPLRILTRTGRCVGRDGLPRQTPTPTPGAVPLDFRSGARD